MISAFVVALVTAVPVSGASSAAGAQAPGDTVRLSLAYALALAAERSPALRAERSEARAADGRARQATTAFLPTLTLGARGVRTTDPVAVFGLKLRQEVFDQQDLSLDALNRPEPFTGYGASARVELPLWAPEGLFGYRAARRASEARRAGAERAGGATRFMVTRAYWGARLAEARLHAVEAALKAARGHAAQAEALLEQGMVTGLDARLARARAGSLDVRRIALAAEAANATAGLGALLALPGDRVVVLTDALDGQAASAESPAPLPCADPDRPCTLDARADLRAHRLGVEAADAALKSAWGSNLPSVALFGALERFAQDAPWGDGSGQWSIGVGVQWTPLRALAGVGGVDAARAEKLAAERRLEAARLQARVEAESATRLLEAARARLDVAASAADEALLALEQARLRYRTGASGITELLDVQAAQTDAALQLLEARHDLLLARAARAFAYGAYDR